MISTLSFLFFACGPKQAPVAEAPIPKPAAEEVAPPVEELEPEPRVRGRELEREADGDGDGKDVVQNQHQHAQIPREACRAARARAHGTIGTIARRSRSGRARGLHGNV